MKIFRLTSTLKTKAFFNCLLLVFIPIFSFGQNGIKFNSADAYRGYTLCSSALSSTTYLLDNCGEIVNSWLNTFPQYYCRLTDEGTLIYISGNRIIEKDWDDNIIRTITPASQNLFLDYEVMKLPNGNYLAAARRIVQNEYFDLIGWNPNDIKPDRVDGVVELDVNGNVVWEWNIGDHTIQDDYPSVSNYGVIEDHPEKIDVHAISKFDWQGGESFMINSIDYNPELDQILISVRKVNEIMIIDHSTTTEEAQGSTGGNSGKGGDILYRWGNPQNYGQGTEEDRVLYFQHNPNWVKYGTHKGKIIMYNNGLNRFIPGEGTFSSVHIIGAAMDDEGNYILEENSAYGPEVADLTIDKVATGNDFYSGYTSGAQVLPNGNIYVTVGQPSDFLEFKEDGTLAWEYTLAFSQFIFRSEKYAPDFPGFEGRDLIPNGTVENPPSTYNCELFTSTKDIQEVDIFTVQFSHSNNSITIKDLEFSTNLLEVRNMHGQLVYSQHDVRTGQQIHLEYAANGMYFITLHDSKNSKRQTHKIVKF